MKNNTSEQITEKDFEKIINDEPYYTNYPNKCFALAQKMVEQSKGDEEYLDSHYWKFVADNFLPERESEYYVMDKFGMVGLVLYGNSGAPKENLSFFDGDGIKAKNIICWMGVKERKEYCEEIRNRSKSKGIDVSKLEEWMDKEKCTELDGDGYETGKHTVVMEDLKEKINSLINEGK